MADLVVTYDNRVIATFDESSTKTLLTKGKYCEDFVRLKYKKPRDGPDMSLLECFCSEFTVWGSTIRRISDSMNGYVVSIFSDSYPYLCIVPMNPNDQTTPLYPEWSYPFEIGVVFKISAYPTYNYQGGIFGSVVDFYRQPYAIIKTDGYIYAGFSTDGEELSSELVARRISVDTWYFLKYKWDGIEFTISITDDFNNYYTYRAEQPSPHFVPEHEKFSFGHCFDRYALLNGDINMLGTYIRINNSLVWGCEYCQKNRTFDIP